MCCMQAPDSVVWGLIHEIGRNGSKNQMSADSAAGIGVFCGEAAAWGDGDQRENGAV